MLGWFKKKFGKKDADEPQDPHRSPHVPGTSQRCRSNQQHAGERMSVAAQSKVTHDQIAGGRLQRQKLSEGRCDQVEEN